MTLSFGYYTGVFFIKHTTDFSTEGIVENYNGNQKEIFVDDWEEDDWEEDAPLAEIKYKKSEREIISTIHSHVISFSLIFFSLGLILLSTSIPNWLKKILVIEPFVSIILTFGGIWLLWKDILWMRYVVMASGILLTITFSLSVIIIITQLLKKKA